MVPEVYQVFWAGMAAREFINDAAIAAGSYRKQGARWLARLEPVSAPHVAQQVRRDAAVRSRAARAVGPLEPVACEGVERAYSGLTCSQRGSISAAKSSGPMS
jgi:hypothetical protein